MFYILCTYVTFSTLLLQNIHKNINFFNCKVTTMSVLDHLCVVDYNIFWTHRWLLLSWSSWYGDLCEPARGRNHFSAAHVLLHDSPTNQPGALCGHRQLGADLWDQLEWRRQLCGSCWWSRGQNHRRVRRLFHKLVLWNGCKVQSV